MKPLAWVMAAGVWLACSCGLPAQVIDIAALRAREDSIRRADVARIHRNLDSVARLHGIPMSPRATTCDSLQALFRFYAELAAQDSARADWKSLIHSKGQMNGFLYWLAKCNSEGNIRMPHDLGVEEAEGEARLKAQQDAAEALQRAWVLGGGLVLGGLGLVLAGALVLARIRKARANVQLNALNVELKHQREALLRQTHEIDALNADIGQSLSDIDRQRESLILEHQRLADSLHYAARIQQALLPPDAATDGLEIAFLHRPAGAVARSCYWTGSQRGRHVVVVADFGVEGAAGAFLSVLGANLLNRILEHDPPAEAATWGHRLLADLRQALPEVNLETSGFGLGIAVVSRGGLDGWGRGCSVVRWRDGAFSPDTGQQPLEAGEALLLVLDTAWPHVREQPQRVIDWVFHPLKPRALKALSDGLKQDDRWPAGADWLVAGIRVQAG